VSLHCTYKNSPHFIEKLWDFACIASIVGIWPRFCEPHLLLAPEHIIPLPLLPEALNGFKIAHLSDLHFSSYTSVHFLERVLKKIEKFQPDLIVFTGDLISYAEIENRELIEKFLKSLSCPYGCYAVLGNHDYSEYISLEDNSFCIMEEHIPPLLRGFFRLISSKRALKTKVRGEITEHPEIRKLFENSGWKLLVNETCLIGKGANKINIAGLGELMAKQLKAMEAFQRVDMRYPTVVLVHNPDAIGEISSYPIDLVLLGHTHGGQVNLPFIWKRITPIKNKEFKSGLYQKEGHFFYISRGLGASFPFRLFAPPELAKITLVRSGLEKNSALAWNAPIREKERAAAFRVSCPDNSSNREFEPIQKN
jgi:uncharacterized protein